MSIDRSVTLYRMFDADGQLLYVGVSALIGSRIQQHRGSKPWFSSVHHIVLEHYDDRRAGWAAERAAIQAERPLYNACSAEVAAS